MESLNKFFHKGGWWIIVIILVILINCFFKTNNLWLAISAAYIIFCLHNCGKSYINRLHIYINDDRYGAGTKCGLKLIPRRDYFYHMWDDRYKNIIYVENDSNNKKCLVGSFRDKKYESDELICEDCLKEK